MSEIIATSYNKQHSYQFFHDISSCTYIEARTFYWKTMHTQFYLQIHRRYTVYRSIDAHQSESQADSRVFHRFSPRMIPAPVQSSIKIHFSSEIIATSYNKQHWYQFFHDISPCTYIEARTFYWKTVHSWRERDGGIRFSPRLSVSRHYPPYPPFVSSDVETLRARPRRDYKIALPPPREIFNLVYYRPSLSPFPRPQTLSPVFRPRENCLTNLQRCSRTSHPWARKKEFTAPAQCPRVWKEIWPRDLLFQAFFLGERRIGGSRGTEGRRISIRENIFYLRIIIIESRRFLLLYIVYRLKSRCKTVENGRKILEQLFFLVEEEETWIRRSV